MSSLKPVIHGRDHLPGGADPIPVEALQAAIFNPKSAEEHLQIVPTTVAALDTTVLSMSHYDGSSLFDLSTAGRAKAVAHGIYALTATFTLEPASTVAGDSIEIWMKAIQVSPAWPPGAPIPALHTVVTNGVSVQEANLSLTTIMAVNDYFQIDVNNFAGYDVDVLAAICAVKILELT